MADLLNLQTLALPLATGLGAFGGFPAAPVLFQDLAQNEWFQWLMVYVLIWQGGGGQRWDLALAGTVVVFVIYKLLESAYFARECPAPAE